MYALETSDESPLLQTEHGSRGSQKGTRCRTGVVLTGISFLLVVVYFGSKATTPVPNVEDYVEVQQFKFVDQAPDVISDTKRVDAIADTRRVDTIADTRRVETIADTRRVDAAADTKFKIRSPIRVETIADTRRVDAIADTKRVDTTADASLVASTPEIETIADTKRVRAIADTRRVEAIADTRRVETIADTKRVETIADTRRVTDDVGKTMEVIGDTQRVEGQANTVENTVKDVRRRALVTPLNYSVRDASIFISMPSYRDNECWKTVMDAFERAANPDRIFFGIYQQHDADEKDCAEFKNVLKCDKAGERRHPLCGRFEQVSIGRVHQNESRGLPYARYHSEQFYNGEAFVLQIDAHTRFVSYWDEVAITAFNGLGNEFGVLSSYPKATNDDRVIPKETNRTMSVGICGGELKKSRPMCKVIKPLGGKLLRLKNGPVISAYFAGGLSFSRGHRIQRVPSDPHLKYVFNGEEIGMSVRLWTHGYDLYAPNVDLIFHVYGSQMGEGRNVFWRDSYGYEKKMMTRLSYWRLHYVMGTLDTLLPSVARSNEKMKMIDLTETDKYGCGGRRDKKLFWKWAKFDLETGRSGNLCYDLARGGLERMPLSGVN